MRTFAAILILILKSCLILLLFVFFQTEQAIAGPLQDAHEALKREDFKTAQHLLKSLADQGNADAQTGLGILYDEGKGVPQDFNEAVKWFRKAAEQGDPMAQYFLGTMYANGRGVSQDYEEAVKWM